MDVPRLRFKDGNGQEFSAWKEKPLQEVCKINQGLQIPISERFTDKGEGRHFYITNEFLKKNSNVQYFIENPPSSVLCSESNVLMTRTGNTGKVVTGVNGAFHNNFFRINYDKEALNKTFLCEFLSREKTQFLILKLAGTSTIPDLNHSDFYKITIQFPSLPEQTKIANFLTAIEEKITQLTQKYDLLKQYKKGVMQQIFRQKLRFKEFSDNWVQTTLSEVSQNVMYGMNAAAMAFDGKNKYIRITDIDDETRTFLPAPLTSPNGDIESKFKLQNGDIVFARTGASVGKSYLYNQKDGNVFFAGFLVKFSVSKSHPYFVFSQTLTGNYDSWVKVMSMRSGQPGINAEEYKEFKFFVPRIEEQTKIANFLTAIDDKITHTQTQLNAVKLYKKGLLQQLFI